MPKTDEAKMDVQALTTDPTSRIFQPKSKTKTIRTILPTEQPGNQGNAYRRSRKLHDFHRHRCRFFCKQQSLMSIPPIVLSRFWSYVTEIDVTLGFRLKLVGRLKLQVPSTKLTVREINSQQRIHTDC